MLLNNSFKTREVWLSALRPGREGEVLSWVEKFSYCFAYKLPYP